ncbi:MAG: DUF6186 family protein [Actinomycetota bacterium]|nr:DUF6186 family protein [Actinomycetota bacterium]
MSSHLLTVLAFCAVGVLLVVLGLAASFTALPVPTVGALLRRALRHRAAQFGLLMVWWWLGWHFFVG